MKPKKWHRALGVAAALQPRSLRDAGDGKVADKKPRPRDDRGEAAVHIQALAPHGARARRRL